MKAFCGLGVLFLVASQDCDDDLPKMMLLQTHHLEAKVSHAKDEVATARQELAMAYVPFNFGHTVSVKALEEGIRWGDCGSREPLSDCLGWQVSEVTGCNLMYTPSQHWPLKAAASYFGNRSVFAILRDPYERLVAQFRGTYSKEHPELGCDVDAGVKKMMEEYLESLNAGKPWANNCNYLPQAEFFEGQFGASIAVDNRLFPDSMNQIFQENGYDLKILTEEVSHVDGCDSKWAADLSKETKELVYKVYHRDFALLCERFGYCDFSENVCLTRVPEMCPPQLFEWNDEKRMYIPKETKRE